MKTPTKYAETPEKELYWINTRSYEDYKKAHREGKWSKVEKYWKIFSESKYELRYVRKLY